MGPTLWCEPSTSSSRRSTDRSTLDLDLERALPSLPGRLLPLDLLPDESSVPFLPGSLPASSPPIPSPLSLALLISLSRRSWSSQHAGQFSIRTCHPSIVLLRSRTSGWRTQYPWPSGRFVLDPNSSAAADGDGPRVRDLDLIPRTSDRALDAARVRDFDRAAAGALLAASAALAASLGSRPGPRLLLRPPRRSPPPGPRDLLLAGLDLEGARAHTSATGGPSSRAAGPAPAASARDSPPRLLARLLLLGRPCSLTCLISAS